MKQQNITIEQIVSQYKSDDKIFERISIFNLVRDFLYQINWATTPEKILSIGEWYCASKHRLLKSIYDELWYKTRLCFIPFSFDMLFLPEELKDWWYANKKWYHVFLQMELNNKWINIDATFNIWLEHIYTVNKNRDWLSSQKIICNYSNVYTPKNDDEEFEIKKMLSDPRWFDKNDDERIEKYNNRIRTVK